MLEDNGSMLLQNCLSHLPGASVIAQKNVIMMLQFAANEQCYIKIHVSIQSASYLHYIFSELFTDMCVIYY